MATPTAGELEERVRRWLTSYNASKLEQEQVFALMNEAANELVDLFDIWFCKMWGYTERDADNAIWDTQSIPPPLDDGGDILTASEIAAGSVPANGSYLRALPYPERLRRPYRAYWSTISKGNELAFLMEDEFEVEYDFDTEPGTPEAYSLSGDSVLLGPVAEFEARVWVQGYYWPTQLESDLDENEFTRHAHTLLVYATQNMIIKYNYEEQERAGLFKEEYNKALRAALSQSGRTFDPARQSVFQRKG